MADAFNHILKINWAGRLLEGLDRGVVAWFSGNQFLRATKNPASWGVAPGLRAAPGGGRDRSSTADRKRLEGERGLRFGLLAFRLNHPSEKPFHRDLSLRIGVFRPMRSIVSSGTGKDAARECSRRVAIFLSRPPTDRARFVASDVKHC